MKRLTIALASFAFAGAILAAPASAALEDYGLESVNASLSSPQAGSHPDFTTTIRIKQDPQTPLNEHGLHLPYAPTRDLAVDIPSGFSGNQTVVDECTAEQLLTYDSGGGCPNASQIGISKIDVYVLVKHTLNEPVFMMVPPGGDVVARFGLIAGAFPVYIDVKLDPERNYALTAEINAVPAQDQFVGSETTIWGVPADPSHDTQRMTPEEAVTGASSSSPRPPGGPPLAFTSNPTSCGEKQVKISARSWPRPDLVSTLTTELPPITGCDLLDFKPQLDLAPSTSQAESATGLSVDLKIPQGGIESPGLPVTSHLKRVEVALPEGVTVNPSAAQGLGVCAPADFAKESRTSLPNQGCPESAKIGNLTLATPVLDQTATGSLYIAKPFENPFNSLLALYMTIKVPERGVFVKLAGKVEPDPTTGRLITTFDDLPQLPFSDFQLHFREGVRAPLITPPSCGSYETLAKLTPWSASDPEHPKASEVITATSSFEIIEGPGHSPCPQGGVPPFKPGFSAGTLNNSAGTHSPFYMRLTRSDGEQDLTRFDATLPPGVVAKLAGVSECPDAAIEAAKSKTGRAELASPSCPQSSEIGHILAGAGVGEALTYVPGKVYLAGPFAGAPLSVAVITPAVAGPFDVGTVVTREALTLDPRSGIVHVDGARSDPIPHILAGIPLKVRDIRVYVDRPQFTLNPTSCEPFQTSAQVFGGFLDVFSSADDVPASLSDRFQAANCANLGFKPKLDLKLTGGTKRGGHPALRGTYRPRPGDANLSGLVLRFPHSAFLDQAHIRTICTRVQFAAKACPEGAVYGHARAITPLLDQPLEGPVYLRSSSHNLPDFVADLHGIVDVEAVASIDSAKGGIRATFTDVPDAPLTKVVVEMQGGKKGLIVNSRNLCASTNRAEARFVAHNGKRVTLRPKMQARCGKRGR